MNTIVKVGIGAGIVWLLFEAAKATKQAFSKFKFEVVSFSKPALQGAYLTVPLQIRFTNPTPLPISIDKLVADVYIDKNGEFVPAVRVNQSVTIQPGVTHEWIAPVADLQSIFGGNFLNTTVAIQQILLSKKIKIRADVTATYQGVELPEQSFTSEIPI